jgi:tetratricopeptide (TPR) repeat protein
MYRKAHVVAAFILTAALIGAPDFAAAVDTPNPAPPQSSAGTAKPAQVKPAQAKLKKKKVRKPARKPATEKSTFLHDYRRAYDLVYRNHDYAGGIQALRALDHDEHADVATMIGYASRKLGRYDEAKVWYDKALESNPRNARTLSYYGMWHAEQGNRLKAQDYLASVRSICGNTSCREYAELKSAIDGAGTY